MITQLNTTETLTSSGGNTNPRARKWCFTLNNYTESEEQVLIHFVKTQKHYIIGREVGESGTPHLQGFFESKSAKAFSLLKSISPRAHWEKARGSVQQNKDYCGKEEIICTNIYSQNEIMLSKYDDIEWYDWQCKVLDIIMDKPDSRNIHVFIDPEGNTGKSFLCKYIALRYNCIIADGKKDNIFNQVKMAIDNKEPTDIIILDIPRHNKDFVNYGCLEQLKNGLLYSGKYEGGKCIFENPHVIIFSNSDLEYDKMSKDRWRIYDIVDDECTSR